MLNIIFPNFIISFLIVILSVPLIIKFCRKYKLTEIPNIRKEHNKPMIRLGGISLILGFQISLSFAVLLNNMLGYVDINSISIIKIQILSLLIFLLGLLDDLFDLNPIPRLISQFLVSFMAWFLGFRIENLYFSFLNNFSFTISLPTVLGCICTMFWIVALINAINWIDGIDGLACSLITISCVGFVILSLIQGQFLALMVSISLLGACIGFLPFNYFPAKLFMGDGGSNFLGFIIAIITMVYSSNDYLIFNPIQAILLIFIPILDMIIVIFRRLIIRQSPFLPDRNHIHHQMLNRGFSHRAIVNFLSANSIIFISIGCCLASVSTI